MAWVFNTVQKAFSDLVEGKRAYDYYDDQAVALISAKKPSKIFVKDIIFNLGLNLPPIK
ncbi:hypothetical protein D3C85_1736540 [compost metagenome]